MNKIEAIIEDLKRIQNEHRMYSDSAYECAKNHVEIARYRLKNEWGYTKSKYVMI